jgi:hypothetical protein
MSAQKPGARSSEDVLIRGARLGDGPALARLAALDSSSVPPGELVVAEAGDDLVAALGLGGGAAIADPFRRTAEIVALLRLRAGQLAPARGGGGVRSGRRRTESAQRAGTVRTNVLGRWFTPDGARAA